MLIAVKLFIAIKNLIALRILLLMPHLQYWILCTQKTKILSLLKLEH